MKLSTFSSTAVTLLVTPFVGVWIEIPHQAVMKYQSFVTPFVGVWIEIDNSSFKLAYIKVTPFVGVWIEICGYICGYWNCRQSLPLWECGLKFRDDWEIVEGEVVTPFVGVWIEMQSRTIPCLIT